MCRALLSHFHDWMMTRGFWHLGVRLGKRGVGGSSQHQGGIMWIDHPKKEMQMGLTSFFLGGGVDFFYWRGERFCTNKRGKHIGRWYVLGRKIKEVNELELPVKVQYGCRMCGVSMRWPGVTSTTRWPWADTWGRRMNRTCWIWGRPLQWFITGVAFALAWWIPTHLPVTPFQRVLIAYCSVSYPHSASYAVGTQ